MISTKSSFLKKLADKTNVNAKFSKRGKDVIYNGAKNIVSPVEAILFSHGNIDNQGYIISKHGKVVELNKLIGKYADKFHGGIYLNLYLSPKNKHYFVIPYEGIVKHIQKNEGKAFIPVIIGLDKIFGNQRWFSLAAEKNASIGIVIQSKHFFYSMIAVGSLNVNNITVDCVKDKKYCKGDYAGHFSVGSTIILCFDKNLKKSGKIVIAKGDKVKIGKLIIRIIP